MTDITLNWLESGSKTWNHLAVCKWMSNVEKNYLSWIAILETL